MIRLQKFQKIKWLGIMVALAIILTNCNLPQSAPISSPPASDITEEAIQMPEIITTAEETAIPVTVEGQVQPALEETSQVFLPQVEGPEKTQAPETALETDAPTELPGPEATTAPQGPATELAYLHEGNLMLVEVPSGTARPLTSGQELISFAWSPDGNQIATFNGNSLCFLQRDGASIGDCLDLSLDETQAMARRQIIWSPDQKSIVLWNQSNPWDEGAIGWIVLLLDGDAEPILIEDPVDWGAEISADNEPGGITGQPVFSNNGELLGTITHRWLCGSGGCHYKLFQFDIVNRNFTVYPNKPEEGFSEGQNLILSQDGETLVNFGTFMTDCDNYFTFVDFYHLETQNREIFNLVQEAIVSMTISPDNNFAVIARSAGCSDQNQETWASTCGLSSGPEVFPMQVWELASNQRSDLLPGISPTWSPNGYWLAFNSCLAQNADGNWDINPQGSPEIMIRSFVDGAIIKIGPGSQPAWRP